MSPTPKTTPSSSATCRYGFITSAARTRAVIRSCTSPDLKIVAGGDAIVNGAPNIDFADGGSAVEWPKLIASTLKLDFDTLIPGHGNVMTKADVEAYKTKWDNLVSRAKAEVKKGTPKDKLLASIKTDDIGWNITSPQWTAPARLDPFYEELSKAK